MSDTQATTSGDDNEARREATNDSVVAHLYQEIESLKGRSQRQSMFKRFSAKMRRRMSWMVENMAPTGDSDKHELENNLAVRTLSGLITTRRGRSAMLAIVGAALVGWILIVVALMSR